jgi:hypothetical protein
MDSEQALREQLLKLLRGGMAHMTFDEAVASFPPEQMNRRAPNVSYTPWQLLEHVRFTQRDILLFITDPNYLEPSWPDDYWPGSDKEADETAWAETIRSFKEDREALEALVMDPATNLYTPIPHGTGQTILREILLVTDHNAYHLGEFAILRQVMGTWPRVRSGEG